MAKGGNPKGGAQNLEKMGPKATKIPREDPQEREVTMKIVGGEREKKREILGSPPFGAPPFGPPPPPWGPALRGPSLRGPTSSMHLVHLVFLFLFLEKRQKD